MKNSTKLGIPVLICILGTLFGVVYSCQNGSKQNAESVKLKKDQMETEKLIIGTYTGEGSDASKGIYLVTRNVETGKLTFDSLLTRVENPTFQAVSPDGKYLYSVSETADKGGAVYSYTILPDKSLKKINEQPSLGRSACHVAVNRDQTMLFVTNYGNGVFTVYHLNEDGSISEPIQHYEYEGSGPHPNQGSSHPHQTTISPDQKYAYVMDLGTDEVHMYKINSKNKKLVDLDPSSYKLPPGSGPRHMTFHPNLPFVYVINELGNTIQALRYHEDSGELSGIELYPTLPEDFDGESYCADIHISPDGNHLYGSNRGHNSLVIFRVDPVTGQLNRVGFTSVHGDWPRNFFISQDGANVYVGNQKSGNISSYGRDVETGQLSLIDSSFSDTFAPVCITEIEL